MHSVALHKGATRQRMKHGHVRMIRILADLTPGDYWQSVKSRSKSGKDVDFPVNCGRQGYSDDQLVSEPLHILDPLR